MSKDKIRCQRVDNVKNQKPHDQSDEVYTVSDWLDDMAEVSGVGYYDKLGIWRWTDE